MNGTIMQNTYTITFGVVTVTQNNLQVSITTSTFDTPYIH